ncbi:hypothetical protein QJQ45_016942 [Haematococcus lacustris]|nr:hypothetical protein QJQ45_016942 [Haematococcus lacustris]
MPWPDPEAPPPDCKPTRSRAPLTLYQPPTTRHSPDQHGGPSARRQQASSPAPPPAPHPLGSAQAAQAICLGGPGRSSPAGVGSRRAPRINSASPPLGDSHSGPRQQLPPCPRHPRHHPTSQLPSIEDSSLQPGGGAGCSSSSTQMARGQADGTSAGCGLAARTPPLRTPSPRGRVQGGVAAAPPAAAAAADERLSNLYFVAPPFPQLPQTKLDSCCCPWSLMLEAGAQNAEALVGPLVEAVLMEAGQRGEGACSQLRALGLPLPPLNAKACIEIMTKHPAFSPRLPVTIHKRLATAATCLAALDTDLLGPEQAVAGQTALRGVLQDCLKAMKLPSLMAAGSTQFQAFLHSLQTLTLALALNLNLNLALNLNLTLTLNLALNLTLNLALNLNLILILTLALNLTLTLNLALTLTLALALALALALNLALALLLLLLLLLLPLAQPHLESGVQFADMLVLDVSEAAAEYKQRTAQRQLD